MPERFDQVLQSWDTANKDTELSNFSVCTTWGIKDRLLFLVNVFRRRMDFPALKRAVRELATMHRADIVLVEDRASGISLIQELRAEGFSKVQPSPALDGDKVMRLRAQTAKIEGGLVAFPAEAPWLDTYLRELLSFPNSKTDDQVDSTVYALAWITEHPEPGILGYYRIQANAQLQRSDQNNKNTRVFIPPGPSHWEINGRSMLIPESRILQVTDEEARTMIGNGCRRIE